MKKMNEMKKIGIVVLILLMIIPIVPVSAGKYKQKTIFQDSFEDDNFDKWGAIYSTTGESIDIVKDRKEAYKGEHYMNCSVDTSIAPYMDYSMLRYNLKGVGRQDWIKVSFSVKFENLSLVDGEYRRHMMIYNNDGTSLTIGVRQSRYGGSPYWEFGMAGTYDGKPIQEDKWYRIDAWVSITDRDYYKEDNPFRVRVKVHGVVDTGWLEYDGPFGGIGQWGGNNPFYYVLIGVADNAINKQSQYNTYIDKVQITVMDRDTRKPVYVFPEGSVTLSFYWQVDSGPNIPIYGTENDNLEITIWDPGDDWDYVLFSEGRWEYTWDYLRDGEWSIVWWYDVSYNGNLIEGHDHESFVIDGKTHFTFQVLIDVRNLT